MKRESATMVRVLLVFFFCGPPTFQWEKKILHSLWKISWKVMHQWLPRTWDPQYGKLVSRLPNRGSHVLGFLEIPLISPNKKIPHDSSVCVKLPRRRSLVRFAELQRPGCHLAVGEWHHCGLPCGHVWWKRSFVSKLCEAQDTPQPGGGLLRTLF